MLKVFFVVMLLSPGMTKPLVKQEPVDSYAACVEQVAKINETAIKLNGRGEEFKVIAGCEWHSDKSDPS